MYRVNSLHRVECRCIMYIRYFVYFIDFIFFNNVSGDVDVF